MSIGREGTDKIVSDFLLFRLCAHAVPHRDHYFFFCLYLNRSSHKYIDVGELRSLSSA